MNELLDSGEDQRVRQLQVHEMTCPKFQRRLLPVYIDYVAYLRSLIVWIFKIKQIISSALSGLPPCTYIRYGSTLDWKAAFFLSLSLTFHKEVLYLQVLGKSAEASLAQRQTMGALGDREIRTSQGHLAAKWNNLALRGWTTAQSKGGNNNKTEHVELPSHVGKMRLVRVFKVLQTVWCFSLCLLSSAHCPPSLHRQHFSHCFKENKPNSLVHCRLWITAGPALLRCQNNYTCVWLTANPTIITLHFAIGLTGKNTGDCSLLQNCSSAFQKPCKLLYSE